jgi:branched-chain amino acid transport system substrate-binding protein
MKRLLVTTSCLFVLYICVSIGAAPALSETLAVANLVPLSGSAAAWGIASNRGLRMMADEINGRGGLKVGKATYTIQVVAMDHRYVPGEAMGAARKAVRDGIKYAIGLGAGIMPAMQPILEENKVIYMASMGAGVEFTNAKCPYTFRTMPSSELQYSLVLAKLVKMFGPIKLGIIYSNDQLGRADMKCVERTIKEQNLPIELAVEFVERDAIDFSPVVTRLMLKKVNLITIELPMGQTTTFVKQSWELGYKGRKGSIRVGNDYGALVKAVGKQGVEGFLSTIDWPPGQYPSAKYEKFHSKFLSLYKEEPQVNSTYSYTAMEFLAAALEKAGTIDTEPVAKVMYGLETETIYGPTLMVGKSLGYGIDTQMSYVMPLCEVRDGRLTLIETMLYKEK